MKITVEIKDQDIKDIFNSTPDKFEKVFIEKVNIIIFKHLLKIYNNEEKTD